MKVLHITAHLGGGVGASFTGEIVGGRGQQVIALEEPQNRALFERVKANDLECFICPDKSETEKLLENADVVVFNWWHHPKMAEFMANFPKIPVRAVLRAHVSGNYFPAMTDEFLGLFQKTVFTSEFSYKFASETGNAGVVYSVSDLKKFSEIAFKKRSDEFIIGYSGTLSFCKLNPNFVDYCAAVDIPNAVFAMAGDPIAKDEILNQAEKKGIADRFRFIGRVDNIADFLSEVDAFAYLLNPHHYGTTENALLEALVAGVPTVALDQCVEQFIIKNNITGFLVDEPRGFNKAMRFVYDNPEKAEAIGKNARTDILERFSAKENRILFDNILRDCLKLEKTIPNFVSVLGKTPADWFLSAVKTDRECFIGTRANDAGVIFREKTKSSPFHFLSYFPNDERLVGWVEQLC